MPQCNILNVKFSNLKFKKLKSEINVDPQVTLILWSNVIGDSKNETLFLLLTDTQVSRFRKAFANNLLAKIKLCKTQLSKMIQSGRFVGPFSLFLPFMTCPELLI